MRTELYADSRDEWKWSVAVRQARETGQSIYWVVMLRPTVGQHGNDRAPVAEALPEVTRFFVQERQHLDEGQPKSLARVTKLCSQLGIELFSHMEAYPATLGQRGHYIGAIVRALEARQGHLKHLVLLDPDNGVGKANTDGKQIHLTHLQWVWNSLREGDTLAIVQFQHRMPDWVAALQYRVAEMLGISAQQVRSFPWANLCLYLIDRPSSRRMSVRGCAGPGSLSISCSEAQ